MPEPQHLPEEREAPVEAAARRPGGLSRHFRKSRTGEDLPVSPGAEEAVAGGDEDEIEELTDQLKQLVARKKARERREIEESAAGVDPRKGRERMTRSGHVNLSVMMGAGADTLGPESEHASLGDPTKVPPATPVVEVAPPPPRAAPSPAIPANVPKAVNFGDSYPPPKRTPVLPFVLGGVAIALFAAGYYLGGVGDGAAKARTAATPSEAAGLAPATLANWRENTVEVLDRALAADQVGDLPGALKLVKDLREAEAGLPGLDRYFADLQIRSGDTVAPEADLAAQITAGRDVAQAFYLRAFGHARQRRFSDAFKLLQASLVLDPFHADGLYQMSELLRRQGKFGDALIVARQAQLRVRPGYGITGETIAFKMHLAQIENGAAADVESAMQEAARNPPVAAEWNLIAAALALQKPDRERAAEWLTKARALMEREDFNSKIDDYFFRNHTASPELSAFRLTEAERTARRLRSWEFFIDP